eukprot:TRINITY_DN7334_c0_g1_i2.p1 TRINITY_DN7334_c0_g1~~TRINITY_DN7334_c0_g1_i2.p1  ORF type:complete len:120 (+),score=17.98 TRINITY_DN7334_c0_g1_i2:2-361(+)
MDIFLHLPPDLRQEIIAWFLNSCDWKSLCFTLLVSKEWKKGVEEAWRNLAKVSKLLTDEEQWKDLKKDFKWLSVCRKTPFQSGKKLARGPMMQDTFYEGEWNLWDQKHGVGSQVWGKDR